MAMEFDTIEWYIRATTKGYAFLQTVAIIGCYPSNTLPVNSHSGETWLVRDRCMILTVERFGEIRVI